MTNHSDGVTITHPPDLLSVGHLVAILEIVQSDSYIADLTAEPEDSIAPSVVLAAARRLLSSIDDATTDSSSKTAWVSQTLDEATTLLSLEQVRRTLAGPSLTVLQRVALLVLHNISPGPAPEESPF